MDTWSIGKNEPKTNPNEPKTNPILANKKPKRTQFKPKQTQYKPKQRPNQYDRIRIPCNLVTDGSKDVIRYKYLGQTKGIGTFHFSEQTVKELSILVSQGKQGQRVHSIFGEGVNPRMRKIRDGLNALGLLSDEILRHGTPRIVYGVNLVGNVTRKDIFVVVRKVGAGSS
ncbi:MAG: Druantia anti-phage system protein DruA [Planctomycetota bacterium]|jgi:hypothetical protein